MIGRYLEKNRKSHQKSERNDNCDTGFKRMMWPETIKLLRIGWGIFLVNVHLAVSGFAHLWARLTALQRFGNTMFPYHFEMENQENRYN